MANDLVAHSHYSRYISLLRGINVGRQKIIPMETLRNIYNSLGFNKVTTYLQSGNVIFESADHNVPDLVRQLEARIEQVAGYHTPVFILELDYLHRIITRNPFVMDRNEDPGKLYVTFLYHSPTNQQRENFTLPHVTADEFAWGEGVIYILCQNGYGRTRLSNTFFEGKLGVKATTRNWNTVNALYSLALGTEPPA